MPKKINRPDICLGCNNLNIRKELSTEQLCKTCAKRESYRRWNEANPGANAANSKQWRAAGNKSIRPENYNKKEAERKRELYNINLEYKKKRKNSSYAWRDRNLEKAKESTKNWRQKNKEKVRGYVRKWNKNNKERVKEIVTAWRKENPHKRFIYADKRRNIDDNLNSKFLSDLMIWQQGACFFCGIKITRENKTLEHIIPINIGGHSLEKNVAWSCSHCNFSRQNKLYGLEWMPEYENWKSLVSFKEEEHFFNLSSFYFSIFGSESLIQLRKSTEKPLLWDFEIKNRKTAIENSINIERTFSARNSEIKEISAEEANNFYMLYHMQGKTIASEHLGLIYDNKLIASLSTLKNEIKRFCSIGRVRGALSKLIAHSTVQYPIFTFCEPRYGKGKAYEAVGFSRLENSLTSSYGYIGPGGFISRYAMQNQNIQRSVTKFIAGLSETEIAKMNGLRKLVSLSQQRFLLKKEGAD